MDDNAFRTHVGEWLDGHYPQDWRFPPRRLGLQQTLPWHKELNEQGWVAPNWPEEYGGMGISAYQQIIFQEELDRIGAVLMPNMGITMLGPLLIRFGTQSQKDHYLPRILNGEDIWCQGYSEPGAGSDLASLRTTAELDGDEWVINGSKIWTTMAQQANAIFLLVRTDKDVKKQKGISFLLAPMDLPGITVREIDNIGGYSEFCEVFFDDVRIPKDNLVGAVNEGWTMAKALLGSERIMLGSPKMTSYPMQRLEALARENGYFDDPAFVDRYTSLKLDVEDHKDAFIRFVEVVRRGEELGPEVSMLKIWITETFQRVADMIIDVAGEHGTEEETLTLSDGSTFKPVNPFYISRPSTIYGGSNEIQRNILAKATLKLPS